MMEEALIQSLNLLDGNEEGRSLENWKHLLMK
jgi:hypothetical protein